MVSLLAIAALSRTAYQTVTIVASESVWVYEHASDPTTDPYIRAWGADGRAVPPTPGDPQNCSYSYLKFDLSSAPKGKALISAELKVTHIKNAGYPYELAKQNPLEARPLHGEFSESAWVYDKVASVYPEALRWGTGYPKASDLGGEEFSFVLPLTEDSKFAGSLAEAIAAQKPLFMALTTKMESAEMNGKSFYKLFSAHGPEGKRPELKLTFAE